MLAFEGVLFWGFFAFNHSLKHAVLGTVAQNWVNATEYFG